ncbi:hypothetical protein [Microbacterium pumilum]|uniref:Uncharacterized protein n=1 Tax=Microbacterium pumilum TaxID=344165 RepID=A0ABN2T2I2_9MICO
MARPNILGDNNVVVKTRVPAAVAEAIDLIVSMTGATPASVLRDLITAGLQPYALVSSEIAAALPTTTYKKEN